MEELTDSSPSDEWEEEVIILVELKGLPNAEEPILTCRDTCSILGMDSPEPMLQLDQYLFKGNYEDIIGTTMVFEQDKGKKLNYICKTDKKLTMSRVILKPKEIPHEDTDVPPTGDSTEEATDYEGTEGTEPPPGEFTTHTNSSLNTR